MSNAPHCVNEFVNSAGPVGLVGRKLLISINRRVEMQPPLIYRPLRAQLEQLREQTLVGAKPEPVAPERSKQIVDEYTSSIRSWQDRATPIQRLRLFTIDELIRLTNLSGRFRVRASYRYTGEALRRCGFKQKRDWSAAGRNKRYWLFDGETQ
jgi:hypothetical protein